MTHRRSPRHYPLDPPPAADRDASLEPLPPPSWVQSLSTTLDKQKCPVAVTEAIVGYFAALEWEGCSFPLVAVCGNAVDHNVVVNVLFVDYSAARCKFIFRGRLDVEITLTPRCGLIIETPPMPLGQAINDGRTLMWQLWRTGASWEPEWDFDGRGVKDAEWPVNRLRERGLA